MSALSASVASPARASSRVIIARLIKSVIYAALEPVSPYSAATFRIIFGLLGLAAVVRFAANGWISQLYIEPAYHLSYYGFGWVQPWPAWGMHLHFALLGLACLGVALGYRYRLSITAFFFLFTYVELIDRTAYLNHYHLVSLLSFTMIFLPLNAAASLDARRKAGGGEALSVPRGILWLLMAQIGLVYFYGGVAKLNPDWLFHAQPLRIWLYNAADIPLIGVFLREAWVAYAASWGGAIFDLTIVGWLLWRRTGPWAYGVLVVFHLTTALLFPALGMFPWIMIGVATIFLLPDWPLRLFRRVRRQPSPPASPPEFSQSSTGTVHRNWRTGVAFAAAALFLVIQLLIPLRHYAYSGNVRWTEEGYLLAWRMMLTEKTGQVVYRVSELNESGERLVYPGEYLTPGQVERMAYQPDLILATAHLIRDDFAAKDYGHVQVRADAHVSYNGRPAARLIDPTIDLAAIQPGIGLKPWIMPEPTNRGNWKCRNPCPNPATLQIPFPNSRATTPPAMPDCC